MTSIIIRIIFGLFVWLVFGQILSKQLKFKRNTKTFINITCKIIGIAVVVFSIIDLVEYLLHFNEL